MNIRKHVITVLLLASSSVHERRCCLTGVVCWRHGRHRRGLMEIELRDVFSVHRYNIARPEDGNGGRNRRKESLACRKYFQRVGEIFTVCSEIVSTMASGKQYSNGAHSLSHQHHDPRYRRYIALYRISNAIATALYHSQSSSARRA